MDNSVKRNIHITHVEIDEGEIEAVCEALRSGKLVAGPKCAEFEEKFARYVGAKYAVAVNSGTSALLLSYSMLLEPGDEVLVPAFTFYATASMVVAVGARPVFCDIDPTTFTITAAEFDKRYNEKVKAIAPVHIFGNSCPVDEISDWARSKGVAVVWDAAQAHGTEFQGKGVAGFGGLSCYSFYPSKNMTTGEGGMITTDSEERWKHLKLLRSQGQPKKYSHTMLAYNFRMTDFQAAIGIRQLEKLPTWVEQRRHNARRLSDGLADLSKIRIQRETEGSRHSYHQFGVQLRFGGDGSRDRFVDALKEGGVMAGVHYPIPLNRQIVFQKLFGECSLPISESLADNVVTLPVHPYLSEKELQQIVNVFRDTYREMLG